MKLPESIRIEWGNRSTVRARGDVFSHRFKQVHGNRIAVLTSNTQDLGETDGILTRLSNTRVGIFTADCVPILFFKNDASAVGAVHAGWRGTIAGIATRFAEALKSDGDDARNWSALVGPSARACCYEVSEELVEQFKATFLSIRTQEMLPKPRHLDLQVVNRHQLETAKFAQIEVVEECTLCTRREDGEFKYFSYRRGDRDARQASTIIISKEVKT